jgi:hypothetical protein
VGDVVLARGARGELVRRAQRTLTDAGFDTKGVDEVFGGDTVAAVSAFQLGRGLQRSGEVDAETWRQLMGVPVPGVRERALQVTAAFEGHGFTLAQGNFDGAGVTWGIIGFTLDGGELSKIILELDRRSPATLPLAFGADTPELLSVMSGPKAKQMRWANSISLGASKVRLAEPWRSGFARLGATDEAQALQLELVDRDYFQPALQTARTLGLGAELGLALAFDIHVQNGGVRASAREAIDEALAEHALPAEGEQALRVIVANAVADSARPQYREDVRSRKVTLATGTGKVHGGLYVLRSWGLGESPFEG